MGKVTPKDHPKLRAKLLADEYEYDEEDALKIWSFGPDNTGANLL